MITQQDNPVYAALGAQLSAGDRYPPEHANIFWNADERGRVKDVETVFIPRGGFIAVEGEGLALWERYAAYVSRWSEDLGNSCDGWMEPDGLTPAQIFGHMLRLGFSSQAEIVTALREFGGIEGCAWAHDMLSAFIDEEEVALPPAAAA